MMRQRSHREGTMGDGFVALYIFMLAAIAGHVIISRVPVILHTPLMSGSNFIHGIVLIGAMGGMEMVRWSAAGQAPGLVPVVLAVLGSLIGAVSLTGSVIAWAKLDGRMDKRYTFP